MHGFIAIECEGMANENLENVTIDSDTDCDETVDDELF